MHKLCAFIPLIYLSTFTLGQKTLKTLVKENEKAIFLIQCYNEQNQLVSSGSGFFIDVNGVALTNLHVIKQAYRVTVKTLDNKFSYIERILDYNVNLDIAKVKVRSKPGLTFQSVKLSAKRSSKGDEVFAIGNPAGLENTVSTGIISSARDLANFGECYQITAPLSPGSSGGPLFNMQGEVIGITTFGQVDNERLYQNLNFAINILNAKYLTKSLDLTTEKAYKEVIFDDFVTAYIRAYVSDEIDRAIDICNKQISRKSNSWLAYHYRGAAYLKISKYSEAEKDFKLSIQLNSTNDMKEWAFIGLGKIYRKAGLYLEAKDAYLKALQLNGKNAICYCNLSVLLHEWRDADYELMESSYMMALQIDPTSCSFGYKRIGEKLLEKQQYEKAIAFFTLAIETEKNEIFALNEYFNRGTCYYYLNQYDRAIIDFEYCLKLTPTDYQSYLSLGLCYIQLGKKLDACIAFRKAEEINNDIEKSEKASEMIRNALDQYCR